MMQKKALSLVSVLLPLMLAGQAGAVTAPPPVTSTAPVIIPTAQPPAPALTPAPPAPATVQPGVTLNAALAEAYRRNPDLQAARAQLKSIDENHAQAAAGFKPSLNTSADYTSTHAKYDTYSENSDAKTLALGLTQSLYSGGSTVAGVEQADNQIRAAQSRLLQTEQGVLLDAVTAYMNLVRDTQILQLNLNNENVLSQHLNASQERFRLGDITKTDVSQAESRLARATANRIAAESNLKKSRAFFERVIGLAPLDLQAPAVLALPLPRNADEAVQVAEKNNPAISYARYTENAAKSATRAIEGTNLPQIDLSMGVSKIYDPLSNNINSDDETAQSIGIRATLPLYTGGSTASRIRQSKQTENQLRMQTRSAERNVREDVVSAWETLAAARAESQARHTQITASKLALDGVQVEADFGSRTTLDLLDAEQEYLDAQVALVTADTDQTVASYGLLSAVGSLTAQNLGLDVPIYNPQSLQN